MTTICWGTQALRSKIYQLNLLAALLLSAFMAACGGGGDNGVSDSADGTVTELSATQRSFQEAYVTGAAYIRAYLPTTGAPDVNAGHHIFQMGYSQALPLSSIPQLLTVDLRSMTPTLTLPEPLVGGVLLHGTFQRIQFGGAFGGARRMRVSASGSDVALESLTDDGHVAWTDRVTHFESVDLTGAVRDAPDELRNSRELRDLYLNGSLLRTGAVFSTCARYFRSRFVQQGDVVTLWDCAAPLTLTGDPTPCGAAATLESSFPHDYDRMYQLSDGTIQSIQGRRAWVSNAPMGSSSSRFYRVLIEYNGRVLGGDIARDGTGMQQYFFNPQAVRSFQEALTF